MMTIPYIKDWDDFGYIYRRLKPTGKWKIESGPYYKDKMFVQHKGLIFKSWIPEDVIVFGPDSKCELFECGG